MSKLMQSNGDDHPEAAGKHLADALALEAASRFDGAAYLAGYVVECALKALILAEHKPAPGDHRLTALGVDALQLAALPNARTAKYARQLPSNHPMYSGRTKWHPAMRYRPPGKINAGDAKAFVSEAASVYKATIAQMKLDGVA